MRKWVFTTRARQARQLTNRKLHLKVLSGIIGVSILKPLIALPGDKYHHTSSSRSQSVAMSRPTITVSKFVGTIGLGLLTVSEPLMRRLALPWTSNGYPDMALHRQLKELTILYHPGRLLHPLNSNGPSAPSPPIRPTSPRHFPPTPHLDIAASSPPIHALYIFPNTSLRAVATARQASLPPLGLLRHRARLW